MNIAANYPLGKTGSASELEHLLGQTAQFADLDYSATGVKSEQSGMLIYARWVKNGSGGTLAKGTVCRWAVDTTYGAFKSTAGAAVFASNHFPCGVVDPWINGTVADGAHFWLIYRGPCKFLFTTGTTIASGDPLILGASGRAVQADITTPSTDEVVRRIGYSLAAVDTAIASGTLFRGYADMWAGGL